MLVGRRLSDDRDIRSIKRSDAWRAADRVTGSLFDRASLQYVLYPSSFAVLRDPWFREADVVQLHNLHGSYFSYSALPWLTRRKPTVWLLHDMWPFTGHVAYSYDCERWRHGCGTCPYLREYPALARDTTAVLWRLKRNVYARSRFTIVTPSRWLRDLAVGSPLLAGHDILVISNGVDVDRFRPRPREEARAELGLSPEKALLLVSAADLGDRRKGMDLLAAALERLGDLDFELLVAGARAPELPRRARLLGEVAEPGRMALAYAAADLFVLPTRAENHSAGAIESLACATPCVSFRIGGMPEIVRHLETGDLAEPQDAAGLAEGIRLFLTDVELRARASRAGREAVEHALSLEQQARRFLDLYRGLAA